MRRDFAIRAGFVLITAFMCSSLIAGEGPSTPKSDVAAKADGANPTDIITQDAMADLTSGSVYNKPGATRAEYNRDWQECRLIARGGAVHASSLGILGGLLDEAVQDGRQRRANRKSCLLIRGWRFVHLSDSDSTRIVAMPEKDRIAYFDTLVGRPDLQGKKVEVFDNNMANPPALIPIGTSTGNPIPPLPTTPVSLAPNQGLLIIGIRRTDGNSMGRSAHVVFAQYDQSRRDLTALPSGIRKKHIPEEVELNGNQKSNALEYVFAAAPAGDYVLSGSGPGTMAYYPGSYCFGAPTFHVNAGEVSYFGDFTPIWDAKTVEGRRIWAMSYSNHASDAAAYARKIPGAPEKFKAVSIQNYATYGCHAAIMDAYIVPGAPSLPPAK